MVEPRSIKNEFFEIAQHIFRAHQCLDVLFGAYKRSQKGTVTPGMGSSHGTIGGHQGMRKPELLVRTKKYNAMEMEMDKFLAKK